MPRKGKCFSTCRKRPKPECSVPECYYTNGNQYKYCRLSFTRKMNTDCIAVPKKPGNSKTEKLAEFRKRTATRKIGRFLRKYEPTIRSKFLQSVCSDSGVCIAFGTHADAIRKHFDDFDNFKLLSKPLKSIGAVSANGFVKELTYEHKGYVANAILKSSANPRSDNLLYEAVVGLFLNKVSKYLPCFVETYGLYEYTDPLVYKMLMRDKLTQPDSIKDGLKRIATKNRDIRQSMIADSCKNSTSISVLIQHLKGVETVKEKCKSRSFVRNDLVYVLFQVYMALNTLSGSFTHYDLHNENVLVYEPVKGKYIEYHYHLADGTEFTFKSPYIAKIIDYGRSYYKYSSGNGAGKFRDTMCGVCVKPACGNGSGYGWLNHEQTAHSYFISSANYHPSHDLRLLKIVGKTTGMEPGLQNLLKRVVYGVGLTKDNKPFGTTPKKISGLPRYINNITDAYNAILKYARTPDIVERNNDGYTKESNKLGDLHIYTDGRTMKYHGNSNELRP